MSIQTRITKLEQAVPDRGCGRCDGTGKLTLAYVRAIIDASDDGVDEPPSHGCPSCQWLLDEILQIESEAS